MEGWMGGGGEAATLAASLVNAEHKTCGLDDVPSTFVCRSLRGSNEPVSSATGMRSQLYSPLEMFL